MVKLSEVNKAQKTMLVQNLVRRIGTEQDLEYKIAEFKNMFALTEAECEAIRVSFEDDDKPDNPYKEIEHLSKQNKELQAQIDKLANFIMENVEGEPSRSEGAVDVAIRLLKDKDNISGQTVDMSFIDDYAGANNYYLNYNTIDFNTSYSLTRMDYSGTTNGYYYYIAQPFPAYTFTVDTNFTFPVDQPNANGDVLPKLEIPKLDLSELDLAELKAATNQNVSMGTSVAQPICEECNEEESGGRHFTLTPPIGYDGPSVIEFSLDEIKTCDCGAVKAGTTHAPWCSTVEDR